jgi:hypothetical protein
MLSLPPLPLTQRCRQTGNQIVGILDTDRDGVVT